VDREITESVISSMQSSIRRESVISQLRVSVDRGITESSPAATSSVVSSEWQDYIRRRNCDTADGSNCEIVNCVIVRANVQ
jgi:hypothetical protein